MRHDIINSLPGTCTVTIGICAAWDKVVGAGRDSEALKGRGRTASLGTSHPLRLPVDHTQLFFSVSITPVKRKEAGLSQAAAPKVPTFLSTR